MWNWLRGQRRTLTAAAVLAGLTLGGAASAQAQYGTSFHYYNPRTGFSYSQRVGTGYRSAYGGFSVGNGRRYYGAGSGFRGRLQYGHQHYQSPRHGYGYRYRHCR